MVWVQYYPTFSLTIQLANCVIEMSQDLTDQHSPRPMSNFRDTWGQAQSFFHHKITCCSLFITVWVQYYPTSSLAWANNCLIEIPQGMTDQHSARSMSNFRDTWGHAQSFFHHKITWCSSQQFGFNYYPTSPLTWAKVTDSGIDVVNCFIEMVQDLMVQHHSRSTNNFRN